MNIELRKRFEEAFVKWLNEHRNETTIRNYEDETLAHFSYNAGAAQGYKEAIALAKEWLAIKGVFSDEKTCGDLKQYLANFETDMNKLWEEKK